MVEQAQSLTGTAGVQAVGYVEAAIWFMTFFFPLLIMAFSLFPSVFARDMVEQAQSLTGTQACRR